MSNQNVTTLTTSTATTAGVVDNASQDKLKSNVHGMIVLVNGDTYSGSITITGKGTFTKKNGEKYIGDFLNGTRTGNGKMTFVNDCSYEGEWKNDQFHGKGKYTWNDGSYYEGNYLNNKREGTGTLSFPKSHCYKGQWKANQYHGNGTIVYDNGDCYSGEWKEGKYHGSATYCYKNGCVFKGQYSMDKINGFGCFTNRVGDKFEGIWKESILVNGTITYTSGEIYKGQIKDFMKSGLGYMEYKDGTKYYGEFKDDKRSGCGILYGKMNSYHGHWDGNKCYKDYRIEYDFGCKNFKLGVTNSNGKRLREKQDIMTDVYNAAGLDPNKENSKINCIGTDSSIMSYQSKIVI